MAGLCAEGSGRERERRSRLHTPRHLAVLFVMAALCVATLTAVLATAPTAAASGARGAHRADRHVRLQLLAINDFHGALSSTRRVDGRPVGGAAVLAAWLDRRAQQAARTGAPTLRLGAGDLIGASPPASALLQDEPTIRALDVMHLIASAVGHHDLDEGLTELLRLQYGGTHPATAYFPGARLRYLACNMVQAGTSHPVLAPSLLRRVGGVRVAVIGAALQETPTMVVASGVRGLEFLDEAAAVNRTVRRLHHRGIETFIVLLHQGGSGSASGTAPISGDVVATVAALDDAVDVVVTAHTHQAYTGMVAGKLVTQAGADGAAFADIDLVLDRRSGDVVRKRAAIVTTFADARGLVPNKAVAGIVAAAEAQVAPLVSRIVGTASSAVVRAQNEAGESPLGDLIADAMRRSTGAQVAFMNPGGIRSDLAAGAVTWGGLFAVQPFSNYLVTVKLSGAQIERLLEQQWAGQPFPRVLQVSGLQYGWHASALPGSKVDAADVTVAGAPLDFAAGYTVTINNFMAGGGDNFGVAAEGTDRVDGVVDLDALIAHVQALEQPFGPPAGDRIRLLP